MRLPQDERFREERKRFKLRFCCEHCALFDANKPRCAHGFPTLEHREARYEDPEARLVFCKEFELV